MHDLFIRLAPWMVTICEAILLVSAVALTFARITPRRSVPFAPLLNRFSQLARRPAYAAAFVGLSVLLLRIALLPVLDVPAPAWHDEFSYLLAADTFAHGRLTNPTHPMWVHFESFHIIHQPSYMSIYPPAQGLVLAAGQLLGHAWIGQWLITGLMCAVLCWALQGWLPPEWALFGSSVAALRLGVLSYWMNTYLSASVPALGGALVLGAYPRMRRRPSALHAVLMGIGLVILANSRPYEGFVYSLPFAIAMLAWLIGTKRPPIRIAGLQIVVPLVGILLLGGLATSYYYYRVTGNPFRMTYQVNRATYGMAPFFLWQAPRPEPTYHHQVFRPFYRWDLASFERDRTLNGFLHSGAGKIQQWWELYVGPGLTLCLLALPWAMRRRRTLLPLLALGFLMLGCLVETWKLPHYLAPGTAALYLVVTQCARHLYVWRWRDLRLGAAVVAIIPVVACALITLRVVAVLVHTPIEPSWPRGNLERARLAGELEQLPGKHLVIVNYEPDHNPHWEWVWNAADIDSSKIVWARDMAANNQELLTYFKDRRVWRLDADEPHLALKPYE